MTVSEVINKYEAKGVELWTEGGQIRFRAPSGILDDEGMKELRQYKEEIVKHLEAINSSVATADFLNRYVSFPLTDIQSAYLVGREKIYELGGVGCHGYIELTMSEIIDRERLEKAWHSVIRRHDMLRASISTKGFQQVKAVVEFPYLYSQDLRGMRNVEAQIAIEKVRKNLSEKQYSPEDWPLCDIYLTITEDYSILHFSIDMLIGDFVSANVILRELDHFYYQPEIQLPDLEINFRDLLLFQQEKQKRPLERNKIEQARKYWTDKIENMIPVPELPLLENIDTADNSDFEQHKFFLEKDKWEAICNTCKRRKVTPSGFVLSGFAEVIGLWAKRPEFCINITMLNRPDIHPQINNIIGDFTTINILHIDLKEGNTFIDRTLKIQNNLWEDLENSSFSGIEVIREMSRKNNKNVIVPIVFTSTIGIGDKNEDSDFMRNAKLTYKMSQTPQVWIDCQVAEQGGGLLINWDVRSGIFIDGMIEDAFEAYKQLLLDLAGNEQALENRAVVRLPKHVNNIRNKVNATNAQMPEGLIHKGFCINVKNHPENTAVVFDGRNYSYRELGEHASAIQEALQNRGFNKGDFAAVILPKGMWQIASVLGALMAGGVYLPIDANQPKARQNMIIKNSGTKFVLTCSGVFDAEAGEELEIIIVDNLKVSENIELNPVNVDPMQPAYIIHTSGTTGIPKGVVMNHHGALNTIIDINNRFNVNSKDRIIGIASLAFDLSVYDIFGILTAGGALVIPDSKQKNNPDYWAQLIVNEKVTVWNTVPAQMQMLMTCIQSGRDVEKASLRLALLSGDWIPVNLPRVMKEYFPKIEIISLGGATEAAIWSIYYPVKEIPEGAKSIPYGTPLLNQKFYVLNKNLQACPDWSIGDLYIGGEGLALGYLGDEKLTEERFILHPDTNERLYCTGDIGRYRPDGIIEFFGREDTQVKIHGHRIELSEIESILQKHPSVASAVAMLSGNSPQDYRINAFITASSNKGSETATEDNGLLHDKCFNAGQKATAKVDRDLFKQWIEVADQTTLLDIIKTFRDAGLFKDSTISHSNEEIQEVLKAAPKLHRLLRRWLNVLCTENYMEKDEGTGRYRLSILPCEDAAEVCWNKLNEIEEKVHYGEKLVNYLRESSKHLPELIRGDVNALDIFFPEGKLDTALAAYHDNLVNLALNSVAKECVVHLAEERSRSNSTKPLRILEVGAGVGGTSIDLIPALSKYNVEYHFTDISTFFLNEAKIRFQQYPWVSYGLFDINKEYWLQGIEASTYDVIVCANVLHNALNINTIIETLKEIATPGGKLIVIEATKEAYTLLTSMEFKDGLTGFTDFRSSTDLTFIELEKWQEVLETAKTEVICSYPLKEDSLALAGQTILIAGFPRERVLIDKEEINEHLLRHLPEYMIPSHIEVLPYIPLSNNGKVDREALKNRMKAMISYDGITENAPQDDLEKRIAKIWVEALHRENIGRDENFYMAGGDSLLVAQVIANMREKLEEAKGWEWERLMREMLQTPTVAEIAKKMRQRAQNISLDSTDDAYEPVSSLVVLAEGKQPNAPIRALFHNGTGTLTAYNGMLSYILNDPERTEKIVGFTFGNEKEYLKNSPDKLIEKLGQRYAKLLLEENASSYELIGYCLGGLIALEAASVLLEAGVEVKPVVTISTSFCKRKNDDGEEEQDEVLLNTIRTSLRNDLLMERAFCRAVNADVYKAGHTVDEELMKKGIAELVASTGGNITEEALCSLKGQYEEVGECYRKLAEKPQEQRMSEIYATMEKVEGKVLEHQANMLLILYKVFCHSFKGVAEYEPKAFAGNVYAMRVTEETKHFFPIIFSATEESWENVVLGDLNFEYIKGAHMTCLQEPNINSTIKFFLSGAER